ncbi:MarR family transcriptional regulator [Corynebacterium sp. sy017]|uniref:MarR family transcriptional regulator n=1 Tax=unclassified Corynebacterium TaxID=2624378 RepID=UPI001185BBBB|nr:MULTISPECIES: MarR family transcriptional regulator [unclassified Corynebacterium]MBP3087631.1 MarR family transcriptional regulator [Corynebacterium sp. sy017]TSD92197.1 MarR family transcriptional regulator [Corynebacterium sp. SY003]
MFAIHARYRGKERRRAQLVERSAQALSTLNGVDSFHVIGVEDIAATIDSAEGVCDTIMALLSAHDWAIALAISCDDTANDEEAEQKVRSLATRSLGTHARSGTVKVVVQRDKKKDAAWAQDIQAAFTMLAFILNKRTAEGREATSLVRSGLNQNEAAHELGISKQAMSQRLQAAGWQAEMAGYTQAISLLERVIKEH